jgi:aldehyde:ferredoxin oxidoreductase
LIFGHGLTRDVIGTQEGFNKTHLEFFRMEDKAMPKILRITTKEKTHVLVEDAAGDLASLGGRGLTSRMVLNEVPPTCHPLSKDNKLIVAPGLLSGTAAANSGRISVGAESP